jgi:Ca-activated chloride channel family protein
MRSKLNSFLSLLIILSLLSSGCSAVKSLGTIGKKVSIGIVYGSEKQDWLKPLIEEFNQAQTKTSTGIQIEVQGTPMGSIEAVDGIIAGTIQPVVWSPASSIYIPVANAEWRKTHNADLVTGTPKDLVLSPVVIAMWKPMAEALGYPQKPLGWGDISQLATSATGWEAYGYPEWGQFKFGHTHPGYSNSGIVAIIAQFYAAAGKQRGLTVDDLKAEKNRLFVQDVQSSIIHYGTSTGFFANRMFERGPSYLSAAVMYENLVVNQEAKRLSGESQQTEVIAIYPKEGTFWANHPYAVLDAPWVTSDQRDAAQVFQDYLLGKPQQERAMQFGFRPSDPAVPLAAPLDATHGIDTAQPKTILEIPSASVIQAVSEAWKDLKKPVDVTVVVDTSGSMSGKKINAVRQSVVQFISMLEDRDRLSVVTFNSSINTLSGLSPLGEKRAEISRRVSGLIEGGDTTLYDSIIAAYADMDQNGDPKHIRAIVVLTDGQDTASQNGLQDVLNQVGPSSEEGGNAIKIFAIAYGADADEEILKQIAEPTGAQEYKGTPENIIQIYNDIATFF